MINVSILREKKAWNDFVLENHFYLKKFICTHLKATCENEKKCTFKSQMKIYFAYFTI